MANFGNSVMKLPPDLKLPMADARAYYYTPHNWYYLEESDLDVSAGGPILIPNTDLLVAAVNRALCIC